MTYPTYSYGGAGASEKDKVRFWVQDTGTNDKWFVADEDIDYVLTIYANPILAAAQVARALSAQFSQKVSKRVADLSINYSDKARQYLDLADELERQGSIGGAVPYSGGISHSDKRAVADNHDRVRPPFRSKQFDNPSGPNNESVFDPNWQGNLP